MGKWLFGTWLYLSIGFAVTQSMTVWVDAHCPKPVTDTEYLVTVATYPAMFAGAAIWGVLAQPTKQCSK